MSELFQNYIVAYMDFLGTKDKISVGDEKHLLTIKNIFEETNKLFTKNTKFIKKHPIKTKIFSDNILMYSKGIGGLWNIVAYSAIFQIRALCNNLTVRGGISYGLFYEDEVFVYGKVLSSAVLFEEQIAVYPRIIIDKNLNKNDIIKLNCIKDSDGYFYLDFYSFYPNIELTSNDNKICGELKKKILALKSKAKDIKSAQKYDWLINYHNSYCKKMKLDKSCFINIE